MLKIAAHVVSKGLTKIFIVSISTGIFPDNWKITKVGPIFEAGLKYEMGNYKPNSVLSTVASVF